MWWCLPATRDMAQLVSDHVTLINTMTETRMDRDGVVEKFGVTPEQIVDYLALVGDKVDNIPGVNKCGPKTAVKWLQSYENLDNVIEHADEIKGKIGEYLREATETLPLSRRTGHHPHGRGTGFWPGRPEASGAG